ncbi:MAG: AAA family ATPase [Planctomycetaceae bacterium]|nr:AAA family ATPase [Planctomycetaceae bacterium]
MKPFRTGVIAGKFYPPHRGHQLLIETALAKCDEVYVLACFNASQTIPIARRVEWLREMCPTAHVLSVLDVPADDDSAGWAAYTRQILGLAPDAVFSSEAYGDTYARCLGAVHVNVDPQRGQVPCSATMIRNDPLAHLDYLAPCVRAWYMRRVCLVGAESTGKTTLAAALADHYHTVWMAEYGREYCDVKLANGTLEQWDSVEFEHIAREHARREDLLARQANRLLIVDTDAFATAIWHRRYMQDCRSPAVERLAAERQGFYALYLLCETDIPWVQDGTRDGQHVRQAMQDTFVAELTATGRPWLRLTGSHDERLRQAVAAIDAVPTGQTPMHTP